MNFDKLNNLVSIPKKSEASKNVKKEYKAEIMELLNRSDYENIIKDNKVVFVCFYATWCPPCRMLRPILEEYMENYPDNLILTINTDEFKDIHKIYDIHNVPTILCFKDGNIEYTLDGYIEYEEIEEKYNELNGN